MINPMLSSSNAHPTPPIASSPDGDASEASTRSHGSTNNASPTTQGNHWEVPSRKTEEVGITLPPFDYPRPRVSYTLFSRMQRLYTSPCRSVRPSVRRSVGNTFTFMPFWPPMSVPKSFLESLISFHKLSKKFSLKKF